MILNNHFCKFIQQVSLYNETRYWIPCKQVSFQFLGLLWFQFLFYCTCSIFKILFYSFHSILISLLEKKQKQNKSRKVLLSLCHLLTVLSSPCSMLSLTVKRKRSPDYNKWEICLFKNNILTLFSKHPQNEINILGLAVLLKYLFIFNKW